jgi:hypothetical protein
LFYHRLTGGRLERFYGEDTVVIIPGELNPVSMHEVRSIPAWTINGLHYTDSLNTIIDRCIALLNPATAIPSIVGHGDAHNGNVFFNSERGLTYFDPAFAGRHDPLLDLTKPLFHNVFAMWMYFPHIKAQHFNIGLKIGENGVWHVDHDYSLHAVRDMFFDSKVQRVLLPILRELEQRGWLRADWRDYLKSALFCCPFLTMNLTDSEKFPPKIGLLGLAMAVEMGAESSGKRSRVDTTLDNLASQLSQPLD